MSNGEPLKRTNTLARIILVGFSAIALILAVLPAFALRPMGFMLIETSYLYALLALYCSLIFLVRRANRSTPRNRIPWYDWGLFIVCLGIGMYFAFIGYDLQRKAYEFYAPSLETGLAITLWVLVLEAVRRAAGRVLLVVCASFSIYPLFAEHMPGLLQGIGFDFLTLARYHVFSLTSIMGTPLRTVGNLLIGFMAFGVVLQYTGGGQFFMDLAIVAAGKTRGGPAKISVIASCFFGTMSGSAVSNVVTVGCMTIPMMKKIGYSPLFAGAVESVASTGGALMPPVMGAVAFIMASVVGVPYVTVAICAFIPAVLYYLGLFVQIDGYAARKGLKGLDRKDIPPIWPILKDGWFFVFVLLLLVVLMVVFRQEAQAAYIALVVLLICCMFKKKTRLSWKGFGDMIADIGKLMADLTAILAAIGLLVGAATVTGLASSLSNEIVSLAGNNLPLLLILGAVAGGILGMGMPASACYIFLAIVLAPALIQAGLNILAVHMFVLYWGIISYITPPVAMAAITAAGISGADAMKTGLMSMRLGYILFIIPFAFVINPAVILQAPLLEIAIAVPSVILGTVIAASSFERYMIGLGKMGNIESVLALVCGLLLLAANRITIVAGLAMFVLLMTYGLWRRRRVKPSALVEG